MPHPLLYAVGIVAGAVALNRYLDRDEHNPEFFTAGGVVHPIRGSDGWGGPYDSGKVGEKAAAKQEQPAREEAPKEQPVWQTTADMYQIKKGVHQPHIAEISPFQYAHLSKRQQKQYDEKRAREWQASADVKNEWRNKVIEAYKAGQITRDTNAMSHEARSVILGHERQEDKERQARAFKAAQAKNDITSADQVKVGDRVYDRMLGQYVTIIKKNKASVVVTGFGRVGGATEMKLPVRQLQFLNYDDLTKLAEGA